MSTPSAVPDPHARPETGPRGSADLRIGDVVAELAPHFPGVSASKVRFLEERGLVRPGRTPAGYRRYSSADVDRLRFVLTLQRDQFLPLKVIRDHLDAVDRGERPQDLPGGVTLAPQSEAERLGQEVAGSRRRWTRAELARESGAGEELLAAGGQLLADNPGVWVTSHLNENRDEIAGVAEMFPEALDYLDTYDRAGLLGRRTILAHNVHPSDRELARMAEVGAASAHCPTSNSNLASGFFPLRRHIEAGVRVALGSDVGAGTGFSLLKEGVQAYFMQQLDPSGGLPLSSAHLLHLATAAGAEALELGDEVGDLSVGKRFDAAYISPAAHQPLDVGIRHASSDEDVLAKIFAMGTPADITRVWVDGQLVKGGGAPTPR